MKTLLGYAFLLITSISYSQNWIDASKTSSAQEAGVRIINGGAVSYYLYSDNGTNDFNIQSTAVSGEGDATPRIQLPFTSPNIHLGMSGGNVAIGHNNPVSPLHIRNPSDGADQYSGLRFIPAKSVAQATYPGQNYHMISGFRRNGLWIAGSENGSNYSRSNILLTDAGISLATSDNYSNPENNSRLMVLNNGNVGIGEPAPSAKLHISNGDVLLQNSSSGYPRLFLKDVTGANSIKMDYNSLIHSGGHLYIRSGATDHLILNDADGGNVGIGTGTPDSKLSVNGNIHAKEVKVDLTGWPDYVFAKDYDLQPLKEVNDFIKQNQRLPEMPSAKEVEDNGVMLGEMNKLLLKKVEELTLYLIEMKEENMDLRTRLEKLELEPKNKKH